ASHLRIVVQQFLSVSELNDDQLRTRVVQIDDGAVDAGFTQEVLAHRAELVHDRRRCRTQWSWPWTMPPPRSCARCGATSPPPASASCTTPARTRTCRSRPGTTWIVRRWRRAWPPTRRRRAPSTSCSRGWTPAP